MALSEGQIEKLRPTLLSLGWQEVIKPVIANSGKQIVDMTMDPSVARAGEYEGVNDDVLKGEFRAYRKILTFFENEVAVHDENRLRDKLRQQMEHTTVGTPYGAEDNGGEPAPQ